MKTDGKDLPGVLNLVVGSLCFAIQLWWEVPPWVSVTVPAQGREWPQGRDEGRMVSHVGSSVGPSRVQETVETVEAVEVGSEEQMGAASVEYGLGMAGGTEAGKGYDGKGKRVVEEMGGASEGVSLRGKGSGPSMFWAESSKGRSLKTVGAHGGCLQPVGMGEPMAHEGFRVGLSQEGRDLSFGNLKEDGLRGLG